MNWQLTQIPFQSHVFYLMIKLCRQIPPHLDFFLEKPVKWKNKNIFIRGNSSVHFCEIGPSNRIVPSKAQTVTAVKFQRDSAALRSHSDTLGDCSSRKPHTSQLIIRWHRGSRAVGPRVVQTTVAPANKTVWRNVLRGVIPFDMPGVQRPHRQGIFK